MPFLVRLSIVFPFSISQDQFKREFSVPYSVFGFWSGREDLNLRPSEPHSDTLPDCATPRRCSLLLIIIKMACQGHKDEGTTKNSLKYKLQYSRQNAD